MATQIIPKTKFPQSDWRLGNSYEIRYKQTAQAQRDIIDFYKNLSKKVQNKIAGMNKQNISSVLEKMILSDIERELQTSIQKYEYELQNQMKVAIRQVAQATVDDARKYLLKIGFDYDDIKDAFVYVPESVVNSILNGTLYQTGWSLSSAIWKDINSQQQEIQKIVAEGVAQGKGAYQIAKDLESYVDPGAKKPWDWSKVYPGVRKKIDYNAQRLARTMINHAFQQGVIQTTLPNPFCTGIRWLSAYAHGRTCTICMDLAEKDSFHMGAGVFPKDQVPLDHPNGLCALAPVVGDLYDIGQRIGEWYKAPYGTFPEIDKFIQEITANKPLL